MKRALIIAGLWVLMPAAAQVSERPESVHVAVYHSNREDNPRAFRNPAPQDGLAFITETRTIDVPAGPATIELRGVASTIIPQTVAIDGLPVPLTERNFDYDLLSPAALLAKSVGERVTLVRTDPKSGKKSERKAVIRTGPHGVVLDFGGSYEALDCSGLKESLVFSKIPDGLRDTPTLSISTNARQAGRYAIRLSYLATNINWAANYVARLKPGGNRLDLIGWVTLVNGGDTGFTDVPLEIVAGSVQRVESEDHAVEPPRAIRTDLCWPTDIRWHSLLAMFRSLAMPAPPPPPPPPMNKLVAADVGRLETVSVTGMRASQDLGDYKLYSLNGSTDINAHQTKLIELLEQKDVAFQRIFFATADQSAEPQTVSMMLRVKNSKDNHLGLALPAGQFTATESDGEATPILLGRANFRDYAVDSPIELEIGPALDIYLSAKKESSKILRKGAERWERSAGAITIENHKTIPIDFELRLPVWEGLRIVSESQGHTVTADGVIWSFHIAAGDNAVLYLTADRRQ